MVPGLFFAMDYFFACFRDLIAESINSDWLGDFENSAAALKMRRIANNTSSTAQGGGGSFKNRKPIGEVGCCESGMAERSH